MEPAGTAMPITPNISDIEPHAHAHARAHDRLSTAELSRRQFEPLRARAQIAASTINVERMEFAAKHFSTTFGGNRDLYSALGWVLKLKWMHYLAAYKRDHIAGAAVDIYPEETWSEAPEIIDTEDATLSSFSVAAVEVFEELNAWSEMEIADRLANLGTYSVLYLVEDTGAAADAQPQSRTARIAELKTELSGTIVKLMPLSCQRATIVAGKLSTRPDRFLLPELYQIRFDNGGIAGIGTQNVHHSRIIHISETVLDDQVHGLPRLERVYNLLANMMKIEGGGSEASWNTAMRLLFLDDGGESVDETIGYPGDDVYEDDSEQLMEENELVEMMHGLRPFARTHGVKPTAISGHAVQFHGNLTAQLKLFAAALRVPFEKLMGGLLGLRSAEVNKTDFDDRIWRRKNRNRN